MSEESKIEAVAARAQSRRAFVKTAAQVAVTAPAAAILLDASVKPAKAGAQLYGSKETGYSDDVNTIGDTPNDTIIIDMDFRVAPGDDGFS
jgi:hypothetical protein